MATNTNSGSRKGAVKGRVQYQNRRTGLAVKASRTTGKFVAVKKSGGVFKGVTKK